MPSPRRTPDALIIAVAVLCLVVAGLGGYVGAYLALPFSVEDEPYLPKMFRWYRAKWMAVVFQPAARVESVIRWKKVEADHSSAGQYGLPRT